MNNNPEDIEPSDIRELHILDPKASAELVASAMTPVAPLENIEEIPLTDQFQSAVMSATKLLAANIPKREAIISPFFLTGDLGFIYGPRGLGKTWLSTLLAVRISNGIGADCWSAPDSRRVLIVDGEMNLDASQERLRLLEAGGENLQILHHEELYQRTDGRTSLNLADPDQQNAIAQLVSDQKTDVLILDNLSCLFRGMVENDADDWEKVLPWLLDFRRSGVSVVIVHHASRAGTMRGTSRREDSAQWVISIENPSEEMEEFCGARFKTSFTKNRNTSEYCPSLLWEFEQQEEGGLSVTCTNSSIPSEFLEQVKQGVSSASCIAKNLAVSKGTVSKWAKLAAKQGLIKNENGAYRLN